MLELFNQFLLKSIPVRLLIVNFFECLIFVCHGQLDFDDRETVFRCPVLLLHGCQPIDLNACFSLICISYVELCQRKQINLLLLLLLLLRIFCTGSFARLSMYLQDNRVSKAKYIFICYKKFKTAKKLTKVAFNLVEFCFMLKLGATS